MRTPPLFLLFAMSALAADPIDLVVSKALGLYNKTDYPAAIHLLQPGIGDPKALELLGQAYFMNGEYKRATDTLERAVALAPNSSMTFTWLGRAYGRRAETSFPVAALGYAQKTREHFETAVKLDPKNGEAVNDLYEFYIEAPAVVGGGMEKARNLLPLIAEIDPVEVHFARARMAEQKKQYDQAETHYRNALSMAPDQPGRVLDVANFLAKRGRFEEADQLFERAEKLAPNSPKVAFQRAESYVRAQRKLDEAQNLLRKYLGLPNLTPDDPPRAEAQKLLKKAQGGKA